MEKVRPWCGQPSDRGRLKNRTVACHPSLNQLDARHCARHELRWQQRCQTTIYLNVIGTSVWREPTAFHWLSQNCYLHNFWQFLYHCKYCQLCLTDDCQQFLPRDATHPRYYIAMGLCLSVCPSQVGVLLKRLNVGSHKQHRTIAQGL